jgi:hypothetical protein
MPPYRHVGFTVLVPVLIGRSAAYLTYRGMCDLG